MEQNKTLGIYITPSRATIVLIGRAGGKIEIAEQFSVAVAPAEGTLFSFAEAAKGIAAGCTEKQLLWIADYTDSRFCTRNLPNTGKYRKP